MISGWPLNLTDCRVNTSASEEEKLFLHFLFETYTEMRQDKNLSHIQEAALADLEKHNVKRDEKKKANPFVLTLRRKCKSTGISMVELWTRTDAKLAQHEEEKRKQKEAERTKFRG
jgi:hypothetical protein